MSSILSWSYAHIACFRPLALLRFDRLAHAQVERVHFGSVHALNVAFLVLSKLFVQILFGCCCCCYWWCYYKERNRIEKFRERRPWDADIEPRAVTPPSRVASSPRPNRQARFVSVSDDTDSKALGLHSGDCSSLHDDADSRPLDYREETLTTVVSVWLARQKQLSVVVERVQHY